MTKPTPLDDRQMILLAVASLFIAARIVRDGLPVGADAQNEACADCVDLADALWLEVADYAPPTPRDPTDGA